MKKVKSKISKVFSLILIVGILLATLGPGLTVPASAQGTKIIEAKALTDHECDDTEWHAIINQIPEPPLAPPIVVFEWLNGAVENVPLDKVTGVAAHYRTTSNLDSPVVRITAEIYAEWDGQFNLSHGPCFSPTPTVTPTETDIPTVTPTIPTVTPTETGVPTGTPTLGPTPTQDPTVTPTGTDIPPETPTPTETPPGTDVPPETETPDPTPVEPPLGGVMPSQLSVNSAKVLIALIVIALVFLFKKK